MKINMHIEPEIEIGAGTSISNQMPLNASHWLRGGTNA